MGLKKKPGLLVLTALIILAVVIIAYFRCGRSTISKTVSNLEPGKAYFWKVIAEDGKGGTVESETRRIEIK